LIYKPAFAKGEGGQASFPLAGKEPLDDFSELLD